VRPRGAHLIAAIPNPALVGVVQKLVELRGREAVDRLVDLG
jgi:hypothetical protein